MLEKFGKQCTQLIFCSKKFVTTWTFEMMLFIGSNVKQ